MVGVSRRTVLRSVSIAAGAAAIGGLSAEGAPPGLASGRSAYRDVAMDARMLWRRLPKNWQEAPFLANGYLGVQAYAGQAPQVLKFMLSHTQVQDQRIGPGQDAYVYRRGDRPDFTVQPVAPGGASDPWGTP
ncbi:hypothetical protein GCM10027360_88320 [Amycolatopsis echigonensis]|nr:hypothetical protein [Amycolatopsis echigonensis]